MLIICVDKHLVRDDQVHQRVLHPIVIVIVLASSVDEIMHIRRCKQDHLVHNLLVRPCRDQQIV